MLRLASSWLPATVLREDYWPNATVGERLPQLAKMPLNTWIKAVIIPTLALNFFSATRFTIIIRYGYLRIIPC